MATRTAAAAKAAVKTKMDKKKTNTVLTMAATTKNGGKRIPAPTQNALRLTDNYSHTDVNGSYTGKPKDKWETPVQDADDL